MRDNIVSGKGNKNGDVRDDSTWEQPSLEKAAREAILRSDWATVPGRGNSKGKEPAASVTGVQ